MEAVSTDQTVQLRRTPALPRSAVSTLPLPPTPLIGRKREIEQLLDLTHHEECRFLTLTGPGGVGKTRLALAVAIELQRELADGCRFISLDPLTDPIQVLPAIARALNVREMRGRSLSDGVKAALRDKQLLLVIDNFEHVRGAAPVLTGILSGAPKVTALVTSRAALHLRGEREFPVEPLEVPTGTEVSDWRESAVDLFVQRALDSRPNLELTPEMLADIGSICTQLDGLPLAIELAAARIKVLPPKFMRARLDYRLQLLSKGPHDLPERHQTMRGAIRWSYELLQPEAQAVFRKLSVFTGGASLDAVSAICDPDQATGGGLHGALEALLDHNLIRNVDQGHAGTRVTMLETIREFGSEQLAEQGDEESVRKAHSAYFSALATHANEQMAGPDRGRWAQQLLLDYPNVQQALKWLIDRGDTDQALVMVSALNRFWEANAYLREGREWTLSALAMEGSQELASRGHALANAAFLAYRLGDYEVAEAEARQGLAIGESHNHNPTIGFAYLTLGCVAYDRGSYDRAIELFGQSLEVYRTFGTPSEVATMLNNVAVAAREQEDYERAAKVYQESLELARESGDPTAVAFALNGLGVVSQRTGDLDAAVAFHEEALALRRDLYHRAVPDSLSNLGATVFLQGNLERAASLYRESLQLRWERGEQFGIAESIAGLLRIAAAKTQREQAVRLWGAVEGLRESLGASTNSPDHQWCQRVIAEIEKSLDPKDFERLYAEGRSLPINAAIAEALTVGDAPLAEPVATDDVADELAVGFSDRELQVLRLLAEGKSDREIGEQLFISHRTVMKHVSNILAKSGAPSRTVAVAYAMKYRLLE